MRAFVQRINLARGEAEAAFGEGPAGVEVAEEEHSDEQSDEESEEYGCKPPSPPKSKWANYMKEVEARCAEGCWGSDDEDEDEDEHEEEDDSVFITAVPDAKGRRTGHPAKRAVNGAEPALPAAGGVAKVRRRMGDAAEPAGGKHGGKASKSRWGAAAQHHSGPAAASKWRSSPQSRSGDDKNAAGPRGVGGSEHEMAFTALGADEVVEEEVLF